MFDYCDTVTAKITDCVSALTEEKLAEKPEGSEYSRLELILAQNRHLQLHTGMLRGWLVIYGGRWPVVLGLEDGQPSELPCYD